MIIIIIIRRGEPEPLRPALAPATRALAYCYYYYYYYCYYYYYYYYIVSGGQGWKIDWRPTLWPLIYKCIYVNVSWSDIDLSWFSVAGCLGLPILRSDGS